MLALLYDIHGNLAALEAVLDDAAEAGADRYLLGGDYALFGAWPAETIDRLEGLASAATWIRGNGERWTATPDEAPDNEVVQTAVRACAERLGADRVRRLANLPEQALAQGSRFCHGSPLSDVRSFFPEPTDDEPDLLVGVTEDRLVFGHTHLPFVRTARAGDHKVELVNPGSVGMPFDGDTRAAYALLAPGGEVEHRRVEYDHARTVAVLREQQGEWAQTAARRIEQARADVS